MSLVEYIDSSGCGAILTALRWVDQIGGQLKLCCLQGRVESIFGLVRMSRILDIFATREEALRAFGQKPYQKMVGS
jgi:anti-sigma B factor antagonist